MNQCIGIICEYNPFHNGHAYQIAQVRRRIGEDSTVIALMSGSVTERGSFAVFPKYIRAQAALLGGADLVLELPYPYCASAAEFFADAGVSIFHALGGVDYLSFGCEHANMEDLQAAAAVLRSDDFRARMQAIAQDRMQMEAGYAACRIALLEEMMGRDMTFLSQPNNILAVAYLAALQKCGSSIRPLLIQRTGCADDEPALTGTYSSATAIRAAILSGEQEAQVREAVPSSIYALYDNCIKQGGLTDEKHMETAILAMLRMTDPEQLDEIAEMTGGLQYRIHSAAMQAKTLDELYALTATKRYTNAKIRRAVLFALTGITDSMVRETPRYTQVLAFNAKGRAYLSSIRRTREIELLTKPADYRFCSAQVQTQYQRQLKAEALCTLAMQKRAQADCFLRCRPVTEQDINT